MKFNFTSSIRIFHHQMQQSALLTHSRTNKAFRTSRKHDIGMKLPVDDYDPLTESDNSKNPKWNPLSPLENVTPDERATAIGLIEKVEKIFDLLESGNMRSKTGSTSSKITKQLLQTWEEKVMSISNKIRQINRKESLLSIYKQLIAVATPITLDPLHFSTYDTIMRAVIDSLLKKYPKNTPITDLVEVLTDIHLEYIEPFRDVIEDGGSEGFSQSARQAFLCYQYATIVRSTYEYLAGSLEGKGFDMSAEAQAIRLEHWTAPIFARLQRRFLRFMASEVVDKCPELIMQSFDRLFLSLSIDIPYRYALSSFDASLLPSHDELVDYPAWDLADTIIKLLRNTVASYDINTLSLEAKLLLAAQNEISSRMRPMGKLLESILDKPAMMQLALQPKEIKAVEDMLNIGHSVVAAILTLWHIKHNIVGVVGKDDIPVKDFILPVALGSKQSTISAIPKYLRDDLTADVDELSKRITPSPYLESAALLAHAVRDSVGENLRALIIFNSDASEWPNSRDECYKSVLTAVLYDAMISPDLNMKEFYQNLIAIAALDEAMGVREPQSSCVDAFRIALRNAAMTSLPHDDKKVEDHPNDNLISRTKTVEDALIMMLRFPEESSKEIRYQTFQDNINNILVDRESVGGGLREVRRVYPWMASYLGVNQTLAKNYIDPLALGKFDKAIGSLLLCADLASSMPKSMGELYRNQICDLADQIAMSHEQAMIRVSLLSGAVFESFMETAVAESRRSNYDNVETLFRKAYDMYRHPLLVVLDEQRAKEKKLRSVGVKMVNARMGKNRTIELLRLIDSVGQRLSEGSQLQGGWGASPSAVQHMKDPELLTFLSDLQQELLQQYTSASMGSAL